MPKAFPPVFGFELNFMNLWQDLQKLERKFILNITLLDSFLLQVWIHENVLNGRKWNILQGYKKGMYKSMKPVIIQEKFCKRSIILKAQFCSQLVPPFNLQADMNHPLSPQSVTLQPSPFGLLRQQVRLSTTPQWGIWRCWILHLGYSSTFSTQKLKDKKLKILKWISGVVQLIFKHCIKYYCPPGWISIIWCEFRKILAENSNLLV